MILAAGAGASAGPLGFLVVLLIGIATVLLIRNMNGRLRRMPRQFPERESAVAREPAVEREPTVERESAADRESAAEREPAPKDETPPQP